MLLFVYTATRKGFVIFTCRYFKLSWNTTALSQSDCRNFSCSSIRSVKQQLAQPSSLKGDQHQFSLNNINLQYTIKRKVMAINMLETMSTLHEVVATYLKIKGALSHRAHVCYRFVMRSGFVCFQRHNNLYVLIFCWSEFSHITFVIVTSFLFQRIILWWLSYRFSVWRVSSVD